MSSVPISDRLPPAARRPWWRRLLRGLGWALTGFVLLSIGWVLIYRYVDPPLSGLMLERRIEAWRAGVPYREQRCALPALPETLALAVIASEDQRFFEHHGFDWTELQQAVDRARAGGRLRGASTLSQQVAKNLFLWSGRSWLRKGLEAWFTVLVEALLPKSRILALYLEVAEWGPGVYGACAAARHHYGGSAGALDAERAARLAVLLPAPRRYRLDRPGAYLEQRQRWVQQQMRQLGGVGWLRRQLRGDAPPPR